jgi:hypothetical protein
MRPVKRTERNVGKTVIYINPSNPRYGRISVITGFRGDCGPGDPYVTLSNGDSTAANQIRIIIGKKLTI